MLAAIGFLLYTGFREGSVYYYTVAEVKADSDSLAGKDIRVAGQVSEGSMDWEASTLTLRFTLIDETETMPVMYHGGIPDNFQEGRDLVVDGKYNTNGIFLADNILTRCPSKYVPQK